MSLPKILAEDDNSKANSASVVWNGPNDGADSQCESTAVAKRDSATVHKAESCGLEEFEQSLSKFTRYSYVRPLATLSYASDIYNLSSIVSR